MADYQYDETIRIGVVPSAPTYPPTTGLLIAASRPAGKDSSLPPDGLTGINSQVPQTFPNGTGRYLMLSYDAWGTGAWVTSRLGPAPYGGVDNPTPNPITVTCSMSETDGSAFYQGAFVRIRHVDGTTTELPSLPTQVTIPAGDSADAVVDLGGASRPAGTVLLEHAYATVNAGEHFFRTAAFQNQAQEVSTYSAGETDKTMQMIGSNPANSAYPYGFWASSIRHIDAPPSSLWQPTVRIGDSLMAGFNAWRYFFDGQPIPCVNLARSGETAATFAAGGLGTSLRRKLLALGGYTRALIQYGANDLATVGMTVAALQANRDAIIGYAQAGGALRVMVATLTPTAASSDGWTTLTNQYLNLASGQRGGREQVRQDYNTSLRAGSSYGATATPHGYTNPSGFYVCDTGGAVEVFGTSAVGTDVPQTIGKWLVVAGANTTGDGLHPGTITGKQAVAPAVPVEFFQ